MQVLSRLLHTTSGHESSLKPPNFNGKPETDLVLSMFVWKTWMENTAKPPDNQQQNMRPKATIVVTSEPFRGNYDTFNATVGIKCNWKIVEGCAFLVKEITPTGQYRPEYRQLDLTVPVQTINVDLPSVEFTGRTKISTYYW